MEKPEKYYTLITGGGSGIGRALAVECAARNMNLILIDLPDSMLESTVKYLRSQYSVNVIPHTIDLTSRKAPLAVYNRCKELGLTVNILINNAGLGHQGSYCGSDYQVYEKMIRLNVEVVVILTRLFLPEMKKLDHAYILNLGSVGSFYPIPFKVVYAGSKAFVYSFSRGLREELKNTSVSVSVLCPGPVLTNQGVISRMRQIGFWGKQSTMRADKVAKIAISKLIKGRVLIVPGCINKIFLWLNFLTPSQPQLHFLYNKFRVNNNP